MPGEELNSLLESTGEGPALFWSSEDDDEPYALDLVRKCSRLPPRDRGYTGAEGCLFSDVLLCWLFSTRELENDGGSL